jgi:hypothetical protein
MPETRGADKPFGEWRVGGPLALGKADGLQKIVFATGFVAAFVPR